ncbi:hypothetical protein VPH35_091948 [Triticum aestivum]|uniref:PGG domain-containing protein n=2 Tax=Triticum TaxID=4564 RepID=A0A9R0XF47_TRITD|nr:unnamed protein product [Triticum turgidum subsp. durum]
MDAKLMVATDPGDVKKLKDVLNKEDAVAMVVVTARSKKPSEEDRLLAAGVGRAHGRVAARDVEEGGDHQPAASLADGALLKGVTPDGDTALHAVASNGDGQDFLKYAGIIYDRDRGLLFAKNHKGDTPLHYAARAGRSEMVSHLIDLAESEGPDTKLRLLRMENELHETALHEAVRVEDGRILDQKHRRAFVNAADPAGEEKNKDDADGAPAEEKNIVKLLIGADPELANYPAVGISPLYLAIMLEKSTIALTLYDMSGGNLSYSGAHGRNALHLAILRDTVMVELLVQWNKSLTTQVDKDRSTPLHFASSLLLSTDSYLRFELLHRPPWCRFVWINRGSNKTLDTVFKANPAALYQADKDGYFPIHLAASMSAKDVIQFFHKEYPDSVRLRDAKGKTFLHVAVKKRRLSIVSYVCRTPSLAWIINMQDNDGNTALHLASQTQNFRMFCALFGNLEVNLNLINNRGKTPLDVSRSKIPHRMTYTQNLENKIYYTLQSVGAYHSALPWDKTEETYSQHEKPEDEDKESGRLKDAAQALIVASVLIATVAFSATFTLPGGYRADDHTNGGVPTLAGNYVFDVFVMATTLAFISSSIATVGFAFAANPMVNMISRKDTFVLSMLSMLSSVTSMSIAFALGVYMVLAPVAHNTAIAVCVITPAILLSANMNAISKMISLARPLCIRKGLFLGTVQVLKSYMLRVVFVLWPFMVTFGWAALARIHQNT